MKAPVPHHPDQMGMFPAAVDTTFATANSPMAVTFKVSLHRSPRQKCMACGNRRICYWVGLGDVIQGPLLCAKCSGIR